MRTVVLAPINTDKRQVLFQDRVDFFPSPFKIDSTRGTGAIDDIRMQPGSPSTKLNIEGEVEMFRFTSHEHYSYCSLSLIFVT